MHYLRYTSILIFATLLFCSSLVIAQQKSTSILFDFNSSELPDTAMLALIKIIASQTIDSVRIQGHCDSVGSKQYNYALSARRAAAVKKLLIDNGIANKVIRTCIGFGKDQPLTDNSSNEDRQINRRVLVEYVVRDNVAASLPKLIAKDLKVGNKLVLKGLQFQGGRHELLPSSMPILENLCAVLSSNPGVRIEIQGHVCCTNKEADGFDFDTRTNNLSENRAIAIYDYLVDQCHIAKSRLQHRGFGGSQKIYPEENTEEQMQQNRRVEIKVLNE